MPFDVPGKPGGPAMIRRVLAAASLTALAGCSMLPTIVPDMAPHPSRPV